MISVIIPIHNLQIELLNRCINSIFNQTYKDYEVIFVLNGCTEDYCRCIYDTFSDEQINIYTIDEKGVSNARNVGVKYAKGEYTVFIDGDDQIIENFFYDAVSLMEKYNLDYLSGGITYVYKEAVRNMVPAVGIFKFYTKEILLKHLLLIGNTLENSELQGFMLSSPCGKMFRTSIVKQVSFRVSLYKYEDLVFNYDILLLCDRIGLSEKAWYQYYQYHTSSIHKYNNNLGKNNLEIVNIIAGLNRKYKLAYENELIYLIISLTRETVEQYILYKQEYTEIKKLLKDICSENIKKNICIFDISKKIPMSIVQKSSFLLLKHQMFYLLCIQFRIVLFLEKFIKKKKKYELI